MMTFMKNRKIIFILTVLLWGSLGNIASISAETIGFVGDIMMHNTQLRRAWLGETAEGIDRGYDFHPAFEWFKHHLQAPDFTVGNLETTFGGPNSALVTNPTYAFREYQAYPTFTTPDSLAAALKDAGFDLVGTANNHCMDSNLEGAARTLDVLEQAGIPAAGTSKGGSPAPWRGKVGDISLSILAWTASVNGIVSPRTMEPINAFNALGTDDRLPEMLEEIRREAAGDQDFTVLMIHWGQEYHTEPDRYQRNLARLAIEAGADIIIGSHPHVLQPVERRIVPDSNGQGEREVFIAWSMGNFISSQRHGDSPREWVDGSMMLNLNLSRDQNGRARVASFDYIPLYVHWTQQHIRVLAVSDALSETGTDRYGLSAYDLERLRAFNTWVPQQMTRYLGSVPSRQTPTGWNVSLPRP